MPRLRLGIALSILLHMAVWQIWRKDGRQLTPDPPRPTLQVLLLEASDRRQATPPVDGQADRAKVRRMAARPTFAASAKTASPEPASAKPALPVPEQGILLEQARQQIDKETRRQMLDPMFAESAPPSRPGMSPLARALGLPVTGEIRVGERIFQYTASNGRRFCITVPPDIDLAHRDLPIPARALVPTNCPQ